MQSPNRAYVPELDQLRGFAALLVFFYHSVHTGRLSAGIEAWPRGNILTSIIYQGDCGVALFMVLSGFVLARGTLGASVDYGEFIRNRALRILPLMVFVVVFSIYANIGVTLSGIVAPFLLLSNTHPRLFTDITDLSGTVWTIAVEFQFYLIAPFVFAFVARRGLRYLLAAMAFVWIAKFIALAPHWGKPLDLYTISHYTIVGRLNQFLVGVGLAYLWPEIDARLRSAAGLRWVALALALGALSALSYIVNRGGGDRVFQGWMIAYPEMQALIFAALIASFVVISPLGKSRLSRWAVEVGVISYSVYILHWCLERLFWKVMAGFGLIPAEPGLAALLLFSLALLPAVLAISWLSYNVVEKPFLDMRRRYISPPKTAEVSREVAELVQRKERA
jgi:peptidoglycan/LPS O-acetylase OafA/YrhL